VARFNSLDPLAGEAVAWTPFRYGFNNPIRFIDSDGLFETEAAAKKYAKGNGIKLKHNFFQFLVKGRAKNNIVENSDGTFSIDNGKDNTSISNLGGDLGIMTASLIKPHDVIFKETEGNIVFGQTTTETLRDGSEMDSTPQGGSIPVGGGGGLKLLPKLKKAFGPLKNWVRGPKGSYSKALGKKTQKSISWGASPAKNGKYLKRIGSPTLRKLNQWLRGKKLPPGKKSWRTKDPGYLNLDKTKPK